MKITTLLLTLFCASQVSFAISALPILGHITSVSGNVGPVLKVGTQIMLTTGINLPADAQVRVVFEKENVKESAILIMGPAQVTFAQDPKGTPTVKVKQGRVLSVVANPNKRPLAFVVKTKAVTLGVRGTTFYTDAQSDGSTHFCACEGKIELTSEKDKKGMMIESKNHEFQKRITQASTLAEGLHDQSLAGTHTAEMGAPLQSDLN